MWTQSRCNQKISCRMILCREYGHKVDASLYFITFSIGLGDTNICFPGSVPNYDNLLTFSFSHSVPNNDTKFNYCWRSYVD